MNTLFILPYQRGVAPLLMMTTFAMEIRTNSTGLEEKTVTNNEFTFEINTNQILTEKDTNIPSEPSIHITGYGTSTTYPKQHSGVSALSGCISVPARRENLDTSSSSTLRPRECVSQYGMSPYEDLTSALLETEYGMLFDEEANSFVKRDRCFSLVPTITASPSAQENLSPPESNRFTSGYSKTDTLSTSLNAFQGSGPVFHPNKSLPLMRQPIAHASKPDPLLDRSGMERSGKSGKKTRPLDRSQSMHGLDPTQLKCAVMNSWYSLKHVIPTKQKAQFSDRPIWLMGEHYMAMNPPIKTTNRQLGGKIVNPLPKHLVDFVRDFQTRIWLTYRKNFPALDGSALTSDCGWGCMIRTGQMMLANGMLSHRMGRDWRIDTADEHGIRMHNRVVSWFLDSPGTDHPFSIHNLSRIGVVSGKRPGDWYGPSQVSFVLRDALCEAKHYNPDQFDSLHIYIARDCTIYKSEVAALMNVSEECPNGDPNTAIIIYIPVRLGKEQFNMEYAHCVKQFLALTSSLGMIGGKPKHSLYFLGFQGDSLICLDPHISQSAVKNIHMEYQTYHCSHPKKLASSKLDPSSTFGFYCKNYQEFLEFCDQANSILNTVKSELYHMFSILEREDTDRLTMSVSADHIVTLERAGSQKSNNSSSNPEDFFPDGELHKEGSDSATDDDDDYVVVSFT